MLQVSSSRLRALDREVFVSPNGVVLVRDVPPGAIVGLQAQTKKAQQQEQALLRLLSLGD